ncbi:hypothetical protein B0O99DRAFT_129120 [Bisporella sp. PMI_857]|nr:hypothetical protein B0O99DRAFT_129120 [Bisporella sp. PMI_857]
MSAKRKLREIIADERNDELMEEPKKASAKSYPRRRTAVACEVCRVRKTRCDAGKPSCGFCTDIGVECVYRLPNDWDRGRARSPFEALERLERRLGTLEEKVDLASAKDDSAIATHPSPFSHLSQHSQAIFSTSPTSNTEIQQQRAAYLHRASFTSSSHPLPEFSFRQTRGEAAVARPNLLAFACPPFINANSWDDTEEFYDDEIAANEQLQERMQAILLQPLDLSRKTTRYLQQSFVSNFLRWMPICDLQDCLNHVNQAYGCNFDSANLSSCFSLLIFAVGAVSDGHIGEELPGLDYFAQANKMLERMCIMTRSLLALQCRVIQACYYHFSIRSVQAWNVIGQASRDCMHLLSSSLPRKLDEDDKEILHRVFWACSILLHELEATIKMHPIGLRHFHDLVPLPLSRNREEDLYYFLAQASLRKLLMETLDVVGHQRGQVIYAPVVTAELQHQSKEWYNHLPPSLKFPIDASPLFDPRKAYLRIQYIGIFIVIGWPSILQVLELGATWDEGSELSPVQEQAQQCLASCTLMIAAAEEALSRRNMGSQLTLWATYVSLTVGLLTYKAGELSFAPETREHYHIQNAYEILKSWDHLPVISRGLQRAKNMMLNAGIPIDSSISHSDESDISFNI